MYIWHQPGGGTGEPFMIVCGPMLVIHHYDYDYVKIINYVIGRAIKVT